MIGDTPRDIACARADGVRCLAVTTGPFTPTQLGGADGVAQRPDELRDAAHRCAGRLNAGTAGRVAAMATPATEPAASEPDPLQIRAVLQPRGPAAGLVLDDAQLAALGAPSKNPPVRVTVNGHTFAGRVARMRGETLIGFSAR